MNTKSILTLAITTILITSGTTTAQDWKQWIQQNPTYPGGVKSKPEKAEPTRVQPTVKQPVSIQNHQGSVCEPDVRSLFSPKISKSADYEFIGDSYVISGLVKNWSKCEANAVKVRLKINDQKFEEAYVGNIGPNQEATYNLTWSAPRVNSRPPSVRIDDVFFR